MGIMKQWWIEHKLHDGNIWKGWINTYAENRDNFPSILKGMYWVEKIEQGWRGYFWLDNQTEVDAINNRQFVITGGIWKPEKEFKGANLQDYNTLMSIMNYNMNIVDKYSILGRFYGNLSKDIDLNKTHIMNI